jgi:hypothetical protein
MENKMSGKNILQTAGAAIANALGAGNTANADEVAAKEAAEKAAAEAAAAKAAEEADKLKVEAFVLRDCPFGEAGTVVRLDKSEAKNGEQHGMLDLNKAAITAAKNK